MYNREILNYSISKQPTGIGIITTLETAIKITSDCSYRRTFHSDRGGAYQINTYIHKMKENQIFQSM